MPGDTATEVVGPAIRVTPQVPIVVLLVAIVLEGLLALRTAVLESNRIRGGRTWARFIRTAKAPELPVILLEDLRALCGLVFALIGVTMTLITGEGRWDAAGTAMIGLLLIIIAAVLAVEMKSLLIGESAACSCNRPPSPDTETSGPLGVSARGGHGSKGPSRLRSSASTSEAGRRLLNHDRLGGLVRSN